MPLFWHGQLVVLVLQIYIHRDLVYNRNDIQKALYPYISFSCVLYYFSAAVMYCNLWYLVNVKYWFILCIFLYFDGIVVINNEMFFCLRFDMSCPQSNSFFLFSSKTGEVRVASVGIRALLARRTRHVWTIQKNSSEIGLVISNENDSLEIGSVVS